MNDSAMLYLTGAVNPLVARAVYPALGLPLYSGEVSANNADNADREAARQSVDAALSKPLAAFNTFFMADCNFIDGSSPSTAEMCLASTLKFLNVFACGLPQWASTYMKAVESELGAVYAEPAADVRGYSGLC